MAESDEFAEFETDEATFDAMLEQAEPAELVPRPACVTVLSAARDTEAQQGRSPRRRRSCYPWLVQSNQGLLSR